MSVGVVVSMTGIEVGGIGVFVAVGIGLPRVSMRREDVKGL